MPFSTSWLVPDRIIYVELSGVVTPAEVHDFTMQIHDMIDAGQPLVHAITDTHLVRKLESIPETFKAVQGVPIHPNGGWYIMAGSLNPFVNFASDFVSNLLRSRYRRFDTLKEAVDFLKERDESLTAALANYPVNEPK